MLENIPSEFQQLKQWVIWKKGTGKNSKRPYNAKTGKPASISDPKTWSSFAEARQVVLNGDADGVGFVLTEDDPYTFIDLDDVIADGNIEPLVAKIIDTFNSYTEISQSGSGIHIIIKGTKPDTSCRKTFEANCKSFGIEIYYKSRYIALTTNLWSNNLNTIEERQNELTNFHNKVFNTSSNNATANKGQCINNIELNLRENAEAPTNKLNKLLNSKRDFKGTWRRTRQTDFNSQSEYDMSLTSFAIAAGWTHQETADLIIHHRRKHGQDVSKALKLDYINRTIEKTMQADNKGEGLLEMLPFSTQKFIQFGREKSRYVIKTENGNDIRVDSTATLTSLSRMNNLLLESGYAAFTGNRKTWQEIIGYLFNKVEVQETPGMLDEVRDWIQDFIHINHPILFAPDVEGLLPDIHHSIQKYPHNPAVDLEGRIYLRFTDHAQESLRKRFGEAGSIRKIGSLLRELGFVKIKGIRTKKPDLVNSYNMPGLYGRLPVQVNVWMSPTEFINQEVIDELLDDAMDGNNTRKIAEQKFEREKKERAEEREIEFEHLREFSDRIINN